MQIYSFSLEKKSHNLPKVTCDVHNLFLFIKWLMGKNGECGDKGENSDTNTNENKNLKKNENTNEAKEIYLKKQQNFCCTLELCYVFYQL